MGDPAAIPQPIGDSGNSPGQSPPAPTLSYPARTVESCERELIQHRALEIHLRGALAQSEAQMRRQDELIRKQELLSKESDHRLMNDLQMTISLLSLQSRAATNPEAAA